MVTSNLTLALRGDYFADSLHTTLTDIAGSIKTVAELRHGHMHEMEETASQEAHCNIYSRGTCYSAVVGNYVLQVLWS
jgi:hypothetical protein